MQYIKLTYQGVSKYVDDSKINKIEELKSNGYMPVLASNGRTLKRFSVDELAAKNTFKKRSADSVFSR